MKDKLPDLKKNSATRFVWRQLNASTLKTSDRTFGFNFMHVLELYRQGFKYTQPNVHKDYSTLRDSAWRFIRTYCTSHKVGWKLRSDSILEQDGRTTFQHSLDLDELKEAPTAVDKLAACPPLPPLVPQGQDARSQVVRVLTGVFKDRLEKMRYEIPGDYRDEVWNILRHT